MRKRKLSGTRFLRHGLLFMTVPYRAFAGTEPATIDKVPVIYSLQKTDSIPLRSDSLPDPAPLTTVSCTDSAYYHQPAVRLNPVAQKFVTTYLQQNDAWLAQVQKRSAPYFRIIESVLQKNELPLQLKYLAVVESELKAKARSRVGAVGPWQLMPGTARTLGLKITKYCDERTHYYKSTAAAAQYLKQLYAQFGDWLLVLAAYNSGAGPVYRAIRLSGSRNFWKLQAYLPAETRLHVKRFIGIHYFFENAGSTTVLTKAEAEAYKKTVGAATAAEQVQGEITQAPASLKIQPVSEK